MTFKATISIIPMGAPRMTQRDKWKKRPVVVRYRAFKDALRDGCQGHPEQPTRLDWIAYLPFPKNYSKKKRAALAGNLHRLKPDRDNIDKAILDTLFKEDSMVASGSIEKRWDDGKGPRIEIQMIQEQS